VSVLDDHRYLEILVLYLSNVSPCSSYFRLGYCREHTLRHRFLSLDSLFLVSLILLFGFSLPFALVPFLAFWRLYLSAVAFAHAFQRPGLTGAPLLSVILPTVAALWYVL
jgi:hypothetical protein